MSRRQDYIAHVRYENILPPTPCAPKMLDLQVDLERLLQTDALDEAALQTDLKVELDFEYGMPIDLLSVNGVFEKGSELMTVGEPQELAQEDMDLLVEPRKKGFGTSNNVTQKAEESVSFLRRTEYVSSAALRSKSSTAATESNISRNPEDWLKTVERTFKDSSSSIEGLKHPKRPNAKAVKSFKLLPDIKQIDLEHYALRMIGSAGITHMKPAPSTEKLNKAFFKDFKIESTVNPDSWTDLFLPATTKDTEDLAGITDAQNDALLKESSGSSKWTLKKAANYNVDTTVYSNAFEEVSIVLSKDMALYCPIVGRKNLKRRRLDAQRLKRADEVDIDELELEIHEPTPEETIERDAARSQFDPVTYGVE